VEPILLEGWFELLMVIVSVELTYGTVSKGKGLGGEWQLQFGLRFIHAKSSRHTSAECGLHGHVSNPSARLGPGARHNRGIGTGMCRIGYFRIWDCLSPAAEHRPQYCILTARIGTQTAVL